jgi:hypothetical protein
VTVLGQLDELLTVTHTTSRRWWAPVAPEFVVINELSVVFGAPLHWLADRPTGVKLREPMVPGPKIPVYYQLWRLHHLGCDRPHALN